MICVQEVKSGASYFYSKIEPQPVDFTTCTMVIPSHEEVAGMNNPFNLSATDGAAIAFAVSVVWGAGFAGRALIKSLKGDSHEND